MRITKIVLLMVLMATAKLQSQMGCMDNSWHLTRPNDDKSYHYVQCNCECAQYKQLADRRKCTNCGHYHIPQPGMSIKEELQTYKNAHYAVKKPVIKDKKLCFDYSC